MKDTKTIQHQQVELLAVARDAMTRTVRASNPNAALDFDYQVCGTEVEVYAKLASGYDYRLTLKLELLIPELKRK